MWWNGKFIWKLLDKDGNVEQEGEGPNMLHQLGQQEILKDWLTPFASSLTLLTNDAISDGANPSTITAPGNEFDSLVGESGAGLEDGDYVYMVSGESGAEVTEGFYSVDTATPASNLIILTADAGAAATGGVAVYQARRLALGLDNRSGLSVTDTAAGVASYEEDGTGYSRQDLGPRDGTQWTISFDSDEGAYTAESDAVTFTATAVTGTDWQANRNVFLASQLGGLTAPASDILIASMSLGGAVTIAAGKSITVQYTAKLTGTNT